MKKGVFSLVLSFVSGITFLVIYYACYLDSRIFLFLTKPYRFLSHTVMLPELKMPGFLLVAVLAVFVNLLALIWQTPPFAMGAAVLYAVSAGLEPDFYPYVTLEFLLCLVAAARMGKPGAEDAQEDGIIRPSQIIQNSQSIRTIQSKLNSTEIQAPRPAAQKEKELKNQAQVIHFDESATSYEALRAKEEKESGRTGFRMKTAGILFLAIVLAVLAVLIPTVLGIRQNRQDSSTQETSFSSTSSTSSTGHQALEEYLKENGYLKKDGSSAKTKETADLTGDWITYSGNSGTKMGARIEDDKVSVYWINDKDSLSLYWTGSYHAPQLYDGSCSWLSIIDASGIAASPFASKEPSKIFTYQNETLSFPVKTMGVQVTVRMRRSEEKLPVEK